jgi:hypothetical protein
LREKGGEAEKNVSPGPELALRGPDYTFVNTGMISIRNIEDMETFV